MKTIVIFASYYLPHLGGIERYTKNLSCELEKNGYKVIIVTSKYSDELPYEEKPENIHIYRLPIHQIFSSRYPIPKKNKKYKELFDKIKKENPSAIIINARFYIQTLIAAKYGYKKKIPTFLIEHGSQHLTVENKFLDFFGAIYEHCLTFFIKKYVNQYYGVSQGACDWQKHFGIESNGIWYNSIVDFSKNINFQKEKNNNINILYAGRIIQQKGVDRLLSEFSKLANKYDNIYLTIAGDGNQLNKLKKQYKSDKIIFLGAVDFEKLKKIYAYTDIFVYAPTWPEGLPTSILEAGLMNCAVIGSPEGGIKEIIINNSTGLMINNNNELNDALEKLIKDKKLRKKLAQNLNKKTKSQFIWESTASKVVKDIENYIEK